eukprot:scaffold75792_cov65-Phaeocystis_antarctica.AAC.4
MVTPAARCDGTTAPPAARTSDASMRCGRWSRPQKQTVTPSSGPPPSGPPPSSPPLAASRARSRASRTPLSWTS